MMSAARLDREWIFGRDGSLTARDADGQWLAGCSLPLRAGREMLRKLDVKGAVACFLAPTHVAQIRAALDRMRPEQAIVVLVPESDDLAAMLHCQDFAAEIESHRLWFASGPTWRDQMLELFELQSGLATPAQFIKVPVTSAELIERLIPPAQDVISRITQRRSQAMQALRAQRWARPATLKLCVVAPTRFRLWNDAGHALLTAAQEACENASDLDWMLFDADDPASSSPLELASRARSCSAILTANTARCDLPGLLPDEMPWLTWVTCARVPSFSGTGPHDHVILADPAAARAAQKAGWPEARVHVATWTPTVQTPSPCLQGEGWREGFSVAIIADTTPLDPPDELNDYSSQTLLWDAIRSELLADPLAVGKDLDAYLNHRIRQLALEDETFPRATFINQLIIPACQQGLARLLIEANVPLLLFGDGWSAIEPLTSHAQGKVESREHLAQILRQARVVLHVWPGNQPHPIDHAGAPVLRPWGMKRAELVRAATAVKPVVTTTNTPRLDGQLLRKILLKICL